LQQPSRPQHKQADVLPSVIRTAFRIVRGMEWKGHSNVRDWLKRDPVHRLQRSCANFARDTADFSTLLEEVVEAQAWQTRKNRDGTPLGSLPALVVAPLPYGLAINTTEAVTPFFKHLQRTGRYALYFDLLKAVKRLPGAPRKTIAPCDSFQPFYTPQTSSQSVDQLLGRLERACPDKLADVLAGRSTPRQAAREAGLLKRAPATLRFGICDIDAIHTLSESVQGKLLCEIFERSSIGAQCTLIARKLDGTVGDELAKRWRARAE
jgi:hypothetical protein